MTCQRELVYTKALTRRLISILFLVYSRILISLSMMMSRGRWNTLRLMGSRHSNFIIVNQVIMSVLSSSRRTGPSSSGRRSILNTSSTGRGGVSMYPNLKVCFLGQPVLHSLTMRHTYLTFLRRGSMRIHPTSREMSGKRKRQPNSQPSDRNLRTCSSAHGSVYSSLLGTGLLTLWCLNGQIC